MAIDHLHWIGRYLVDRFHGEDLCVIQIGDFWDMPSLSSYDKGKRAMEGRRYVADIAAGNAGFNALCHPLEEYNEKQKRLKERQWWPERHFLMGNHEDRITRAVESDAQLEGLVSLDQLDTHGWQVHPFLEVVEIDGILYSHYFANPMTGRPYSGMNIEPRLKTIGASFSMGHQQTFMYGIRYLPTGRAVHGLVAGACYLHSEDYLGPQGNAHWRGIVVKHQVEDGNYDIMPVSLDYLCRRYEGVRLAEWMREMGYDPR